MFLAHDAAHRQIFRSHAANENAALVLGVAFGGISLAWWLNKHNRHHAAPNQIGRDPDIDPTVVHFYPAARRSRSGLGRFVRGHQGWWFFPLLLVEALNLHVQGVQAVWSHREFRRRRVELSLLLLRLVAAPAVLFLVLPPGKAAAFLAVQLAVTGVYLGVVFSASHIGKPVLAHDPRIDFLRRQVLTSRNVRGGRLTGWLMGGLNLQIEHHLFPSVANNRLRKVRPIVEHFCAQNSIGYQQVSIGAAWVLVARYLNGVGLRSAEAFRCPMATLMRLS